MMTMRLISIVLLIIKILISIGAVIAIILVNRKVNGKSGILLQTETNLENRQQGVLKHFIIFGILLVCALLVDFFQMMGIHLFQNIFVSKIVMWIQAADALYLAIRKKKDTVIFAIPLGIIWFIQYAADLFVSWSNLYVIYLFILPEICFLVYAITAITFYVKTRKYVQKDISINLFADEEE